MNAETYTFQNLDELYETADELPDVSRHDVYAHHTEADEWSEVPYRDSLWTDDGRTTGVVSTSEDFYNVIQYGDILSTVGDAIEQRQDEFDLQPQGYVSLSPTAHKMSSRIDFGDDAVAYPSADDPIDIGLQIRSGHSGFHAVKYDIGAERVVCSNGMTAFLSDLHFEQSHGDPFDPGLAFNAVEAVAESPETVEQRLEAAQNRELMNTDEALLVLMDLGIDDYLETPVPDLLTALNSEVEDPESPTLYETYNAGTRALTHFTSDVPDYELDQGLDRLSDLLDSETADVPEPERIGRNAIERRTRQLVERGNQDPYWEGEVESLRDLREAHDLLA